MEKYKFLVFVVVIFSMLLAACATPAPATQAPAAPATAAPAAPATAAPAAPATAAPAAPATEAPKPVEGTIVDFGYTGDIQTGLFGKYMAEPFMKANPGATIKLIGGVSGDAITQIKAAQGKSPIDTMLLGKPRYLEAARDGWILPISGADIPNVADVYPNIQEQCSPSAVAWTVEVIGLVYNPDLVAKPEKWEDLWKPEYKGKIGVVSPSSNAGFLFYEMIAKTFGTGEADLETVWKKLDELKPFIVANNPETLSQLLENKEIAVAINWNTEAAVSIGKGFNVKFTMPAPGGIGQVGCYAVIKGTEFPDLAKKYINTALGLEFQQKMSEAPYYFAPVNKNVVLTADAAKILPSANDYPNLITIDLNKALPLRQQLTDEFIKKYGQ
jgi:putative spermidine/putrescine transport system substrate-binding protein